MSRAATGVLGGTFNPVHLGHLRAAEEVAEALGLARVLLVPSSRPPHKRAAAGDPIAPAPLRLAWVRAAVADNPRLEADALEVERGGASFLVDTLRDLGRRLAPEKPVFLLGSDAFQEIETWRDPDALLALAHFAVMTRPPRRRESLREWLPASLAGALALDADGRSGRHRSAGTWIRLVEITALDISASDVRRRLREGRSVRYLLPEAVRCAVEESGAYAAGGA